MSQALPHDALKDGNSIGLDYLKEFKGFCRQDGRSKVMMMRVGCTSCFLGLPALVREKIYTYLSQSELLKIRSVCIKLLEEVDNFADFSVVMNNSQGFHNVSIPFPYLKLLTIDNDQKDLPWKMALKDVELVSMDDDDDDDGDGDRIQGSVQAVHLGAISFPTFLHLSHYKSIKSATLTTSAFIRPIPSLHWVFLKALRVKFHVLSNQMEQFMLDNFDSLCVQHFPHLESLSIAMCNTVYPNIQSAYSIRILRFVTKHWKTMRFLDVTMEAECCVSHHYVGPHMCPGLSDVDLADMRNVKLETFTLNATELSCPRCSIWQEFIRQQTRLQTVEISISCAMRLRSDFFCPVNPNSTEVLQSVNVTLWGMDGYFPFDLRHFSEARNLRNLELVRHTQARSQVSRPELLNVGKIPAGLVSLTFNGFLISAEDVPVLLRQTRKLRNLILIDCGFGLDIGVLMDHISCLAQHPSYATAIIDFNSPVISSDEAITLLSEEMDRHNLIFQYLFEIATNKNHRFWFVHPDRVELASGNKSSSSTLEKAGYSTDILLSCNAVSEYPNNFYFDDFEDDMRSGPPLYYEHHPSTEELHQAISTAS